MARPKKNGHFVSSYIDNTLYNNLEQMSKMSNMTKTAIIEKALASYLNVYANSEHKINPVEAFYLDGASEYEQQVAKNEGRELIVEKKRCYVLEETTIFGQPYYKIYDGNDIRKVPAAMVEFD